MYIYLLHYLIQNHLSITCFFYVLLFLLDRIYANRIKLYLAVCENLRKEYLERITFYNLLKLEAPAYMSYLSFCLKTFLGRSCPYYPIGRRSHQRVFFFWKDFTKWETEQRWERREGRKHNFFFLTTEFRF
jgi:hypothetical protein